MSTDERIEKIERQLVRMRWFNRCLIICIFLSLVIGLTFLLVRSSVKEIRANSFIIEDENGKQRALFGVRLGGPCLVLMDEYGKPNAHLVALKDSCTLSLSDDNNEACIVMGVYKHGPSLTLADENGKPSASLSVNKDNSVLSLHGENGETRAGLAVFENKPNLSLTDENGKERAGMNVGKIGPYLMLSDENCVPVWTAP